MPKTRLGAGKEIETLNQAELREVLGEFTPSWFQEEARGFTTARFSNLATVDTGAVQVPASNDDVFGPAEGFAWRVTRVSAYGLSANDTLGVYRNDVSPLGYLGLVTATANLSPGKGIILRGGEKLVLATLSGLTATGDIVVTGEAVQCSELDIFKIL